MHNEVKIGLLGAGTVGGGVILVLKNNAKEIEKRVGVPVRIVKVFTRRPEKVTELDDSLMVTNSVDDILDDPEIDIVIELIGREDPAKEYIARALAAKGRMQNDTDKGQRTASAGHVNQKLEKALPGARA